jgi:hypothetical protein
MARKGCQGFLKYLARQPHGSGEESAFGEGEIAAPDGRPEQRPQVSLCVRPLEVAVLESRQNVITRLRAEYAEEAASGFARLRRIPQTDIIWFLDHFAGLSGTEREALLDALADSGAMAFGPPYGPKLNAMGTVDVPPALARRQARPTAWPGIGEKLTTRAA